MDYQSTDHQSVEGPFTHAGPTMAVIAWFVASLIALVFAVSLVAGVLTGA